MADFSDDFNRADSGTTIGGSWETLEGVWGIASNQARYVSGGTWPAVVHDSGTSDVEVEVTYATFEDSSAIVIRASDAANMLQAQYSGGLITLYKMEAGSRTSLGDADEVIKSHGDVWKVVADGDQIEVFQNGASVLGPITTSFNLTATKHGLLTGADTHRFDDFSITDLGGGEGGPPPPFRLRRLRIGS